VTFSWRRLAPWILSLACAGLPATATAETFGVRGGFYAEAGEPYVGAELLLRVSPKIQVVPNFEWVLVEEGSQWVGSVDAHYDLSCSCSTQTLIYAGAGVAVLSREVSDTSHTDVGLNLLGGFGLRLGRVIPYVQLRGTISETSELSIGVGLRF
jgi:hypothetical protein